MQRKRPLQFLVGLVVQEGSGYWKIKAQHHPNAKKTDQALTDEQMQTVCKNKIRIEGGKSV